MVINDYCLLISVFVVNCLCNRNSEFSVSQGCSVCRMRIKLIAGLALSAQLAQSLR